MKTYEYKPAVGSTIESLSDSVNDLLQYGWQLHGHLVVYMSDGYTNFCQPMIREVEQRGAWD